MHARLVRFAVAPGSQEAMTALGSDLLGAIRQQPGVVDVTFLGDDSDGQWGVFVRWESAEAAMAAAGVIRPQLDAHLSGKALAPPDAKGSVRNLV